MTGSVILRQEYAAKLDSERWLVLSADGSHHWHFDLVGPEPLASDIEDLTATEAKEYAANVVEDYLKLMRPDLKLSTPVLWRTAVVVLGPERAAPMRVASLRGSSL